MSDQVVEKFEQELSSISKLKQPRDSKEEVTKAQIESMEWEKEEVSINFQGEESNNISRAQDLTSSQINHDAAESFINRKHTKRQFDVRKYTDLVRHLIFDNDKQIYQLKRQSKFNSKQKELVAAYAFAKSNLRLFACVMADNFDENRPIDEEVQNNFNSVIGQKTQNQIDLFQNAFKTCLVIFEKEVQSTQFEIYNLLSEYLDSIIRHTNKLCLTLISGQKTINFILKSGIYGMAKILCISRAIIPCDAVHYAPQSEDSQKFKIIQVSDFLRCLTWQQKDLDFYQVEVFLYYLADVTDYARTINVILDSQLSEKLIKAVDTCKFDNPEIRKQYIRATFSAQIDRSNYQALNKMMTEHEHVFENERISDYIVQIVELIAKNNSHMIQKVFIIKRLLLCSDKNLDYAIYLRMQKAIDDRVGADGIDNMFALSVNPLLLGLLTIQIIKIASDPIPLFQQQANVVLQNIQEKLSSLLDSLPDGSVVNLMLKDRDMQGIKCLSHLVFTPCLQVCSSVSMKTSVSKYAFSNYQVNGNIMETSSSYRLLTNQPDGIKKIQRANPKKYELYQMLLPGSWAGEQDVKMFKTHQWQFYVWKKAISTRFTLDLFTYLVLALIMLTLVQDFNRIMYDLGMTSSDFNELRTAVETNSSLQEQYDKVNERRDELNDFAQETIVTVDYICYITLTLPLKSMMQIIYVYYTERQAKLRTSMLIDLVLVVLIISTLIIQHQYLAEAETIPLDDVYNELGDIEVRLISTDIYEGHFQFDYLLSCLATMFWIKILVQFELMKTWGPMLNIIASMVMDVLKFTVLYGVVIIAFFAFGTMVFTDIEMFRSNEDTFYYLFQSGFGSWDFSVYEDSKQEDIGNTYLLIFLIVSMLLLLNLVIAVMSSTYAVFEQVQDGLYTETIINEIPYHKYDSRYGAFTCAQVPFNIIVLPFIPCFMLSKNRAFLKQLNSVLCFFTHLHWFLIGLCIYTVNNATLAPFAYFKKIQIGFHRLISVKDEQNKQIRIAYFFAHLLFGLPIALLSVITDLLMFTTHWFESDLKQTFDFNLQEQDAHVFGLLYKAIQEACKEADSEGNIMLKRCKDLVNQHLQIEQSLNAMIYGQEDEVSAIQAKQRMHLLSSYMITIFSFCLKEDQPRVINVEQIRQILDDVQQNMMAFTGQTQQLINTNEDEQDDHIQYQDEFVMKSEKKYQNFGSIQMALFCKYSLSDYLSSLNNDSKSTDEILIELKNQISNLQDKVDQQGKQLTSMMNSNKTKNE